MHVEIQRLGHYPKDSPLPEYMTGGAAGVDLRAAIAETVTLKPLERLLIPTGIALAIESGFEAQIRPRSGLALQRGLTLLNSPGTIDSDYRGEIKVLVANFSDRECRIEPGERIAQMVFSPVSRAVFREVSQLPATERQAGGFGHTGTK